MDPEGLNKFGQLSDLDQHMSEIAPTAYEGNVKDKEGLSLENLSLETADTATQSLEAIRALFKDRFYTELFVVADRLEKQELSPEDITSVIDKSIEIAHSKITDLRARAANHAVVSDGGFWQIMRTGMLSIFQSARLSERYPITPINPEFLQGAQRRQWKLNEEENILVDSEKNPKEYMEARGPAIPGVRLISIWSKDKTEPGAALESAWPGLRGPTVVFDDTVETHSLTYGPGKVALDRISPFHFTAIIDKFDEDQPVDWNQIFTIVENFSNQREVLRTLSAYLLTHENELTDALDQVVTRHLTELRSWTDTDVVDSIEKYYRSGNDRTGRLQSCLALYLGHYKKDPEFQPFFDWMKERHLSLVDIEKMNYQDTRDYSTLDAMEALLEAIGRYDDFREFFDNNEGDFWSKVNDAKNGKMQPLLDLALPANLRHLAPALAYTRNHQKEADDLLEKSSTIKLVGQLVEARLPNTKLKTAALVMQVPLYDKEGNVLWPDEPNVAPSEDIDTEKA